MIVRYSARRVAGFHVQSQPQIVYLHESNNLNAPGREGTQYARNSQMLNFDQVRIQIPPKKNPTAATVSRLSGRRYVSLLRFHSSLALRLSVGDKGVPNKCAETVRAIIPAMANIKPTSWIKKMFAIHRFYQCWRTALDKSISGTAVKL
jgi:hypothetical protein